MPTPSSKATLVAGLAALAGTILIVVAIIVVIARRAAPPRPSAPVAAGTAAPAAAAPGAAAPLPPGEAELRALLHDDARVADVQPLFVGYCATCHGANGEGNMVGPNLRDGHWLHGANMVDIANVIAKGVPGTPMQPMKGITIAGRTVDDDVIRSLAVYVVRLKGGSVGKDKAPQGQLAPIGYWP